tara:strand:+ start:2243 stop:2704 length:462 start_codon:yes stop_codon:yes gene_type:complete
MKKLLILLLLPLFSFSQTYKDVMSIKDVDTFKKVAIENNYEFTDEGEEGLVTYGYNIVKDSINGNKSSKWAFYQPEDDMFVLTFSKSSFFGTSDDTQYDKIYESVKDKCSYYKIINNEGTDFVTYSCPESSYKGKIGFVVMDDTGIIMHFPNE